MLHAKGLQTFLNFLSAVPEGSLFEADNVVIDRDGVIEPRRGLKVLADIPSTSKQLFTYKDTILTQYGDALSYYNGTSFVPYEKKTDYPYTDVTVDLVTPVNNKIKIPLHE